MQKKQHSLLEAAAGVLIGYAIAIISQIIIYPRYGMILDLEVQAEIAGLFTIISLIRSYSIRRLFNFIHIKGWLWVMAWKK